MSQTYKFKNITVQNYYGDVKKTGTVELSIDWGAVVDALGKKAAFNRSRKSGLGIGIKAKFIENKAAS